MSSNNQSNLTIQDAKKILNKFNCVDIPPNLKPSEKTLTCQALVLLAKISDYQILGICAETSEEGILAMKTYSYAFGYEPPSNLPEIEGPVYIKLNGKNGICHLDSYSGHHRGVLVSCQSYSQSGINEMYGHLPLDLFV
ncbi:MAG: DUF1824 family protein [Brasilonema octagenarum HA4186-MV1]|jgi:hypothetical protein|uniref:DUF1824 domain-containing protein n=2 Tax=Brasilonema TaxID=383614 RepID=A0A856MEX0_9CYAN|nr:MULTISPECIES: DUF1824 family protein [Brasilonema]MBW4627726.1 DUF1824 family protein [Brasilonema octagenarum HA4186-MV1]NMF64043.1 DUF1824 domain-containing protein [Brasilonema octagenarum UFV-OR1]QDL09248.1 DUF1824 domain-containing protein [Brasilonema sennae CENA114]QDL15607.1 DUF1824 domain-containing protein [Brasilonema octagenarum UFV-E1]